MLQAVAGHEQVISVLLRRGADVTLTDKLGQTAADVARSKRVQTILRQHLPPRDPADKVAPDDSGCPLKAQSFGKIQSASSTSLTMDQRTSTPTEHNAAAVSSRPSSTTRPVPSRATANSQRINSLERMASQEAEHDEGLDDQQQQQRGASVQLTGVRIHRIIFLV